MRMPIRARNAPLAVTCLAILALVLVLLPATAGARVVISDGKARLTLDRSLARQLGRQGVELKGLGRAAAAARVVKLPVAAGATNGALGRGALTIAGGFAFDSGSRVAKVGDVLVNTGKGQSTARIAGEHRILAKHGGLKSSPAGFGTRIQIRNLKLTRGTSTALNRKLGLRDVFRPGRRLGSLVLVAIPATVPIAFGNFAVGGPETTFSKLESIDVQLGLWGGARRWAAPGETYFVFEVAPAEVAPDASTGELESGANDGISMEIHESPPRNMLLRGPRINLGNGELTATISALSKEGPETSPIGMLDYSTAQFQIRPRVGVFELMGIRAVSNQFIADQLNARFLTPGFFQPGETLARITVTLHAAQPRSG
jgi:hypothetical protein